MRFLCTVALLSAVLVACSAEDGKDGLPGATGAPGKDGVGSTGPKGDPGTVGPTGPTGTTIKGEKGDKGDPGAKGDPGTASDAGAASAFVKVLSFDSGATSFANSFTADTPIAPTACRTATYTAGAGESAIVAIDASVQPNVGLASLLYLSVGVGTNGGALASASTKVGESMNDGAAAVGTQAVIPLTAGTAYVFGAIVEGSANSTGLLKATCIGSAMVVKTTP